MAQSTFPLSRQAMQVMDQDGETAMWKFIEEHLQTKSPQGQEPPKTACMEDGSLIQLSDNTYTFLTAGPPRNPAQAPEQRKSIEPQGLVPGSFQPAQPLHIWPTQEHLYQALVQMALDQEWDKLHPGSETPRAEELNALLEEALYAVHWWTPTSNPDSQSLTDELEAHLTGLAASIFQTMDKAQREALTRKAADIVSQPRR